MTTLAVRSFVHSAMFYNLVFDFFPLLFSLFPLSISLPFSATSGLLSPLLQRERAGGPSNSFIYCYLVNGKLENWNPPSLPPTDRPHNVMGSEAKGGGMKGRRKGELREYVKWHCQFPPRKTRETKLAILMRRPHWRYPQMHTKIA